MAKKEESNSEYVSVPVYIEYGTTDPTEHKGNYKISCPSNPIILKPPEKNYYSTKKWFPKQVPCVTVEGEYVPVENIETLNCEEDSSGRDLLTFLWKGEQKQSFVTLKYL